MVHSWVPLEVTPSPTQWQLFLKVNMQQQEHLQVSSSLYSHFGEGSLLPGIPAIGGMFLKTPVNNKFKVLMGVSCLSFVIMSFKIKIKE
jgi:hypothetical protein